MWGIEMLKPLSLRGRLGFAAFAGLFTTALLTGLLLLTANAASHVVDSARLAQQRSRIFLQLQSAATDYQHASFKAVRDKDPATLRRVTETRTRLENLLAEANRLPAATAEDAAADVRISTQVTDLIVHFARSEDIARRINQQWQEHGSKAAMAEANKLSAPIFVLRETLQAEITRGDESVAIATGGAEGLIRKAVIASLVAVVLVLLSSLVMLALLQTRLRPGLSRLEAGANAFGKGKLDHRIRLGGNDELSRISDAFDSMAQTIADEKQALEDAKTGLEHAVAARTDQLEKANAQLSGADERRRAFFAEISHELRTPLTVIKGEAQVAQRAADKPGFDPRESFDRILEQADRLSRIVTDLFLIARAQAGGLPLNLQQTDLGKVAGRIVSDFENLAAEGGGAISLVQGGPVIALIDPERIKRALSALVENALAHCHEGVRIEVTVSQHDGRAIVCVQDDGPGLDFENAEGLFKRFQRGTTRGTGSGLGLSLVNALAAAHGGTASLGPGQGGGTCARIELPLMESKSEAA